ncbi:Histone deacetylase complex subunit SAP18 [Durusdinium trenchii]|uniref:Histone deacetylase complex subunit SAP18 n=1 Tax=Durusdinium trenchii TaxID=1381693 RepID=A0ABP0NWR7_9DINO
MWVWRFACLVAGAGAARPSGGSYRGVASAAFEDKPGAIAPASPELVFEMRSIARFWLFLGFVGLTGYGSSVLLKNNRLEQDFDVSRSLKLVAVKLHKEKVFMQTVCGAILPGAALFHADLFSMIAFANG